MSMWICWALLALYCIQLLCSRGWGHLTAGYKACALSNLVPAVSASTSSYFPPISQPNTLYSDPSPSCLLLLVLQPCFLQGGRQLHWFFWHSGCSGYSVLSLLEGCPSEGPKFLPFQVIPKLATSELHHMLQRREAGHGEPSHLSGPGLLSLGKGLLESPGNSVTIQWPSLCLKFVKLFLICFKGSGLHPPGLLTVGFGEHVSPTEFRRQSGSPWSGIPSWMGKSSTDFYLDTALLLSSCLGATLQVILRRNNSAFAPTGYKNDFILDSLYFIEVFFILVSQKAFISI